VQVSTSSAGFRKFCSKIIGLHVAAERPFLLQWQFAPGVRMDQTSFAVDTCNRICAGMPDTTTAMSAKTAIRPDGGVGSFVGRSNFVMANSLVLNASPRFAPKGHKTGA